MMFCYQLSASNYFAMHDYCRGLFKLAGECDSWRREDVTVNAWESCADLGGLIPLMKPEIQCLFHSMSDDVCVCGLNPAWQAILGDMKN